MKKHYFVAVVLLMAIAKNALAQEPTMNSVFTAATSDQIH